MQLTMVQLGLWILEYVTGDTRLICALLDPIFKHVEEIVPECTAWLAIALNFIPPSVLSKWTV